MCYVCTKSSKVLHIIQCGHITNVPKKNKRFIPKKDVTNAIKGEGYGYCKDCSRIGRMLKKEKKMINPYCEKHNIQYQFDRTDDSLVMISRSGTWKVLFFGNHHVSFLYHKNTKYREVGLVPGYHSQQVHCSTLFEYFEYVAKHDRYRAKNPVTNKKGRKNPVERKAKRSQRVAARRARDRISDDYTLELIRDWEQEQDE